MQTTPIKCPHCGSLKLEFVSEIHKCAILRFFAGVVLLIIAFLTMDTLVSIFLNPEKVNVMAWMFFVVIYAILKMIIGAKESKSHVQGICRDCGTIWLLN